MKKFTVVRELPRSQMKNEGLASYANLSAQDKCREAIERPEFRESLSQRFCNGSPVISFGIGIPSAAKAVGAISRSDPPGRSERSSEDGERSSENPTAYTGTKNLVCVVHGRLES